jgi:glycine cleavage system H protein
MTTYYTPDHEYIKMESGDASCNIGIVGITHFAQDKLGDLVFAELPALGDAVTSGDDICVIESVKAAAEVKAPLDGEIIAVNQAVADDPTLVNSDPEGAGWFFKMKITDTSKLAALMDKAAYEKSIA